MADVPGGLQLVLATRWRLLLFDSQAKAVNVSGDGRLADVALRDGTIRCTDFAPAAKVRSQYHRPEMVTRALQ